MFYCNAKIGRLEEKYLLGEIKDELTLESLKPSAALFEPSVGCSFSSVSSGTAKSRKSKRPTHTISIQASEQEIDAFTSQTLDQSWLVPNLQSQSFSRLSSAAEDDFEPIMQQPRIIATSPKPLQPKMPEPGPPQKIEKPKKSPINTPQKKKHGPSIKNKFESYEIKYEPNVPTERNEDNMPTLATEESTYIATQDSAQASLSQTLPVTHKEHQTVKKKKRKDKSAPPGAFFFPALLSSPPVLNIAPVNANFTQGRDILFFEDQF